MSFNDTNNRNLAFASLFSGAGIGDVGLRASGLHPIAMCEVDPERSALAKLNFQRTEHFAADIEAVAKDFVQTVRERVRPFGNELFLVSCTAPCQGMSKSGKGTLLKNIREGKRPALDPRNRLILPALDIICDLMPTWVVFENVLEMRDTLIVDQSGHLRPILDIIKERLGQAYEGTAYDVEFADYGVPQRRQRLITIFTRDELAKKRFREGHSFIPPPSHSARGTRGLRPWVSVMAALAEFESLDSSDITSARSKSTAFHYVPVLDPKKYEWIRHAKSGMSAFDNQCINPECLSQENPTHGNTRNGGINQASKTTPLYCATCGSLLPRPYTETLDGQRRIMSGFTSAYKRMSPDLPAPALTRNLSYPCSDNKIHPFENRVLSLAEAMTLQTISRYVYKWGPFFAKRRQMEAAPDSLIRLVIGESVPPLFMELLSVHLQRLTDRKELGEDLVQNRETIQMPLLISA